MFHGKKQRPRGRAEPQGPDRPISHPDQGRRQVLRMPLQYYSICVFSILTLLTSIAITC